MIRVFEPLLARRCVERPRTVVEDRLRLRKRFGRARALVNRTAWCTAVNSSSFSESALSAVRSSRNSRVATLAGPAGDLPQCMHARAIKKYQVHRTIKNLSTPFARAEGEWENGALRFLPRTFIYPCRLPMTAGAWL
jgi:hypothetical protein